MNNPLSWFSEASQRRLETICVELKQEALIQTERAEFDILFRLFIRELSKEQRAQFLQLEESWTRLEGLEKEGVYKRGMKDGAQLMMLLLQ